MNSETISTSTHIEWSYALPKSIIEKYQLNFKHGPSFHARQPSIHIERVISNGFDWYKTPEGGDYWHGEHCKWMTMV